MILNVQVRFYGWNPTCNLHISMIYFVSITNRRSGIPKKFMSIRKFIGDYRICWRMAADVEKPLLFVQEFIRISLWVLNLNRQHHSASKTSHKSSASLFCVYPLGSRSREAEIKREISDSYLLLWEMIACLKMLIGDFQIKWLQNLGTNLTSRRIIAERNKLFNCVNQLLTLR